MSVSRTFFLVPDLCNSVILPTLKDSGTWPVVIDKWNSHVGTGAGISARENFVYCAPFWFYFWVVFMTSVYVNGNWTKSFSDLSKFCKGELCTNGILSHKIWRILVKYIPMKIPTAVVSISAFPSHLKVIFFHT